MTPQQVHPTHHLRTRDSGSYVCSRCQRYTDPRQPEGHGLYDAGLRQPCDQANPPSCRCHRHPA
jgi:hypothetical protein